MEEVVVLDPLKYFVGTPHIFDLIFQHFKVLDLKQLSIVSHCYESYISSSSCCMRKIKLRVSKDDLWEKNINLKREYQSVAIDYHSVERHVALITNIMKKSISWKHIEIIAHTSDIMDILIRTQNNTRQLEELKVSWNGKMGCGTRTHGLEARFSKVNFDSLKSLYVTNLGAQCVKMIAEKSSLLTKLSLTGQKTIEWALKELWRGTTFKLESFHLSKPSDVFNSDQRKKSLDKFLRVHKDSLKELILDVWPGIPVLNLIFCMPKLHQLHLKRLAISHDSISWEEESLPVSSSIKKLLLDDPRYCPMLLKCFLKSCPNIESLEIHDSLSNVTNIIQTSAPQLRATSSNKFIS